MIVYPAIDIKDGKCVRLKQGDMGRTTLYHDSPQTQARLFSEAGAEWVHVVDLDGAVAGTQVNGKVIESILDTGLQVQLGGGIRTRQQIDAWLERGVARVVLGSLALSAPEVLRHAAKTWDGRIAVAADAKDGLVASQGWLNQSATTPLALVKQFEDCGVAAVIFTDIGRDGMLAGINREATCRLAEETTIPVIASGGIAEVAEIKTLAQGKVKGVIIGRALYDGRIDLAHAIKTSQTSSQNKPPAKSPTKPNPQNPKKDKMTC